MLKRPKIKLEYYQEINRIPVEIVYFRSNNRYVVYVYSIYKEGKGVCFSSCEGPNNPFDKWFYKLEKENISYRLKELKKLIRKLKSIIENRDIPFKGVRKTKPKPPNYYGTRL